MRDTGFFENIYERSIKNTGFFMTYIREACRAPPRQEDQRPFFVSVMLLRIFKFSTFPSFRGKHVPNRFRFLFADHGAGRVGGQQHKKNNTTSRTVRSLIACHNKHGSILFHCTRIGITCDRSNAIVDRMYKMPTMQLCGTPRLLRRQGCHPLWKAGRQR